MMKNKAVFLDRDGVINRERNDYTWKIQDLELLPGVVDFIRALRQKGYMVIVITNQGGIAKGLYSKAEYLKAEEYLSELMKAEGLHFDEVYFCPHHPQSGKCLCRKPGSQMLEKAIARFNIDPELSFMIGDRDRDVDAGRAAGLKSILVESNSSLLPILGEI